MDEAFNYQSQIEPHLNNVRQDVKHASTTVKRQSMMNITD